MINLQADILKYMIGHYMWMFCLDMMLILLIGLRLICVMIHVSVCGQLQLAA